MNSKKFIDQLNSDEYLREAFRSDPLKTVERFHLTFGDALELAADLPSGLQGSDLRDLQAILQLLEYIAKH